MLLSQNNNSSVIPANENDMPESDKFTKIYPILTIVSVQNVKSKFGRNGANYDSEVFERL